MIDRKNANIKTAAKREVLEPSGKLYGLTEIWRGARLGYQRNKGPGKWVLVLSTGKGREQPTTFATADDQEPADGVRVLNYQQAIAEAVRRATAALNGATVTKHTVASILAPVTWKTAIEDYKAKLKSEGKQLQNATRILFHTPAWLLLRPIAQLTTRELRKWRTELENKPGMTRDNVTRTLKVARAMLNYAADMSDGQIKERPWKLAFSNIGDRSEYQPTDRIITEKQVRALIDEAYKLDPAFGLFIHVYAVTGARPSQIAKIKVGDLRADSQVLIAPPDKKGRGARKLAYMPIGKELTERLMRAKGNRRNGDFLLLNADLEPFDVQKQSQLRDPFAKIAKIVGIKHTSYCLRHTSIVRDLKNGVPIATVAKRHSTSVEVITQVYAWELDKHDIDQSTVLEFDGPEPDNVIPLKVA